MLSAFAQHQIKPRPLEMRVGQPISTNPLEMKDMEQLSARVQKEIEILYRWT